MGSTWGLVLRNVSRALAARRSRGEESEEGTESGFTLIELMVVLLIMGILLAIAIPTFLGLTGGANDRAAQSNLTNALTNAKAVYAQSQTFGFVTGTTTQSAVLAKKLHKSTTSLNFTAAKSTTQNTISVDVIVATATTHQSTQVYLAAWMPNTGVCWFARAIMTAGTNSPSAGGFGYLTTTANFKSTATQADKCVATNYATIKKATTAAANKGHWTSKFPASPTGH